MKDVKNILSNKRHSTNKPLVTVAIPLYRGEFIKQAIDSVLSQSFKDFELIIVDDASDDKSRNKVLSYTDSRIIYVRNKKNLGAEGNWNRCLALAKGKYIKILPHDDTLEPECLKEQVGVLNDDLEEKIALVFCIRKIINTEGKQITVRGLSGVPAGRISAGELVRKCVLRGTNLIGEPGAVLFRSNAAKAIGNFNGKIPYVIDLDYWVRLLSKGSAYFIDKPLSTFRVSSSSWSVKIGASQSKQFARFISLVAKNPENFISAVDQIIGRLTSSMNCLARRMFYLLVIR
jgi:glycosyltransferase involved in cell wall biosynthesis